MGEFQTIKEQHDQSSTQIKNLANEKDKAIRELEAENERLRNELERKQAATEARYALVEEEIKSYKLKLDEKDREVRQR